VNDIIPKTTRSSGVRHLHRASDPVSASALLPAPESAASRPATVRCGCCGLLHGRALRPGEHCDWCAGHGVSTAVTRPWHLVVGALQAPPSGSGLVAAGRAYNGFGTLSAWFFLLAGVFGCGLMTGAYLYTHAAGEVMPADSGGLFVLAAGLAVLGAVQVAIPRLRAGVDR
jgi:hypothetical protein